MAAATQNPGGSGLAATQPLRSAGGIMGNQEDMRGATDRNYQRNAQTGGD
tara:strand:+ start:376 stop:525 length:150 start_codon:yes stop_codon:yes gene_type:complete